MANFPATFPALLPLTIERTPGYVQTNIGGVLNQWDNSPNTLCRFTARIGPLDATAHLFASIFLSGLGMQEQTTFPADGKTYTGTFTGIFETNYEGKQAFINAEFWGNES